MTLFAVFTRILEYDWGRNKLAVVEEEKPNEYIVYQYWIDDGMKLQIAKNLDGEPKWILKRLDNGQILIGKKMSYLECNERFRKNVS